MKRFDCLVERYTDIIAKFRVLIIFVVVLLTFLTVLFSYKKIDFEGHYRIWFEEDSEVLKEYDYFKAAFGTDEVILITFTDEKGIFTKKAIKTIKRITDRLQQTRYIARVDSIVNYQYIHTNKELPDEVVIEDFISDVNSITEKELKKKEEIAILDNLVRDILISADGKTTTIIAKLIPISEEDIYFEIRKLVEEIVQEEASVTGYKFYLTGTPVLNTEFVNIAEAETKVFLPIIVLLVFLVLYINFRTFSGPVASLLVVFFTSSIVIGIYAIMGFRLNNFTVNIPVFAMSIGVADAVHIYWCWLYARRTGKNNREAIKESLQKNFVPVIITSLTTFVGFISLSTSNIVPVKTLGIAMAAVSVVAFILSITFLPALLYFFNPAREGVSTPSNDKSTYAERYASFIMVHRKKILIATIILSGVSLLGLFKVQINSNKVKYFSEDTLIRRNVKFVEEKITGPDVFEIIIDSKKTNGIKDPYFLKKVEEFYVEYTERFPHVRHLFSIVDILKRLNKVVNNSETIPEDGNLIGQYLLLYNLSLPPGRDINDRVDITERFFRITANCNTEDSVVNSQMIEWIKNWWTEAGYDAMVTGHSALFVYLNNNITFTLIYSLSITLVLVTFIMFVTFQSLRLALLSLIPNLLPLLLTLGLMGWMNLSIEVGIAVSCAIIIGIAIDDTVYMLSKFIRAAREYKTTKDSLKSMITFAGVPALFTTLILSTGFAVLTLSKFTPNRYFGFITASALMIALIADLFVLPAILSFSNLKWRWKYVKETFAICKCCNYN